MSNLLECKNGKLTWREGSIWKINDVINGEGARRREREGGREYNVIRGVGKSIVNVLNLPYMHILHIESTSVCRGENIVMPEKGNTRWSQVYGTA
jgi:hypothetical protein